MATSNLPQQEETLAEYVDRLRRDPRWTRLWERLLTPANPATTQNAGTTETAEPAATTGKAHR